MVILPGAIRVKNYWETLTGMVPLLLKITNQHLSWKNT